LPSVPQAHRQKRRALDSAYILPPLSSLEFKEAHLFHSSNSISYIYHCSL
jgi:hypothetical protein